MLSLRSFTKVSLLCAIIGIITQSFAVETKNEPSAINFNNRSLNELHHFLDNPPGPVTVNLPSGGTITLSSAEIVYQEKAFLKSVLGLELESQIEFDENEGAHKSKNAREQVIQSKESFEQLDAINAIAKMAKLTSVVMLNEAHHISKHRIFALQLAQTLREQGYTHIAGEAFYNVKSMMDFGFPTTDNGPYIKDPEFGHFVRQSMRMGFRLIEYESSDSNRETGQAENLARFLKKNPTAKVFVYAGYGHIRESSDSNMMASKFRLLTGVNPLTIDQVGGSPRQLNLLTDENYSLIKGSIDDYAAVFKRLSDGRWLTSKKYENDVDLTVFHTRETLVNRRASWLSRSAHRKAYKVNIQIKEQGEPLAIKAVLDSEWLLVKDKAVPVDQISITKDGQSPTLYLPIGIYRIYQEGLNKEDVLLERIQVDEKKIVSI